MKRMRSLFSRTICLGVACSLACGPVMAGPAPGNLSDIEYQSADWADEQLGRRGYTMIQNDWHNNRKWSYWWQQSSKTCVKVQDDGRKVQSVETTSGTDCNQRQDTSGEDGGMSTGAKVALGAAALIGVAMLAHQSHHRDGKHGQDEKSVAEFDRGYRDGLHHERYHNYDNTNAYSDGYNAGQQDRDERTSYRARDGRHSGNQRYVSLDDLVGSNGSSAENALNQRGFRSTGGYKQDNKSFTTWWNTDTRQCMQVVAKEGRIKRIESIAEGNCT